jgi:hypothetical protein
MKKFVAGVMLGFLASWVVAFAAVNANHDGLFWNKLTRQAKDGYVNGYADAMRVSVAKLDSLTVAGDLFHWRGSGKIIHQLASELSMSELTPGEAVHRLDALYGNQKYSELDLGSALQLLALRAHEGRSLPSASAK